MSLLLLTPDLVRAIHKRVQNLGELTGEARDKSLDGALARVDNRLAYGMIDDAFDLAAAYAVAIATGHCFNDGNKRTAYEAMVVALELNGVVYIPRVEDVGPLIIEVAQGRVAGEDLADWLRTRAESTAPPRA